MCAYGPTFFQANVGAMSIIKQKQYRKFVC